MVETTLPSVEEILTNIDVNFYNVAGGEINTEDFTVQKVVLGESLLTPGLQTSIRDRK